MAGPFRELLLVLFFIDPLISKVIEHTKSGAVSALALR